MSADLLALLDQLDEARAKATPGPWRMSPNFVGGYSLEIFDVDGLAVRRASGLTDADAALIVAAVNALPELISELRKHDAALRAVLELHARRESYGDVDCVGCRGECLYCESEHEWPCPTVDAITAALTPEQVQP